MKQFGIGLLTMTLGAVGTTGSRAQEVSYIIPTPKAELLQTASKAKLYQLYYSQSLLVEKRVVAHHHLVLREIALGVYLS